MKALNRIVALLTLTLASNAFAGEVITYIYNDPLGSPIAGAAEDGTILWKEHYAPFGKPTREEMGSEENTIAYTGKQIDRATGLQYFGARYYNPVIGRFYSIDPVEFREDDAHSFNRYAYANNSPYKYVDPDGNLPVIPVLVFLAKEGASILFEEVTGLPAIGSPSSLIRSGARHAAKNAGREGIETAAETSANRAARSGDGPRFIGQPDGQVVDTTVTPRGRYDQPDGGRTDILQTEDHGAGLSHTHDPKVNINPKTGESFVNGLESPGRPVSRQDVENIQSGIARQKPPKKR